MRINRVVLVSGILGVIAGFLPLFHVGAGTQLGVGLIADGGIAGVFAIIGFAPFLGMIGMAWYALRKHDEVDGELVLAMSILSGIGLGVLLLGVGIFHFL